MKARAVFHVAPRQVALREVDLPAMAAGDVRVRVEASGLSAGTERLIFNGQLEPGEPLDTSISGLEGGLRYPFTYGYCAVGVVEDLGAEVDGSLRGRRVFVFAPHQSQLVVRASSVIPLPEVDAATATLLANVETAVSLVMDGAPLLGEVAGVVGLGVVGQLVAAILAKLSLGLVLALEPRADRRAFSWVETLTQPTRGACDVVFELSGKHAGLASALEWARDEGRVIAGSWYGPEAQPLVLGTRTHRARQSVRFSQVSHIDASLRGRFDHARRMQVALTWLQKLELARFVTHRFPAERAADAFNALHSPPEGCLHTVLTWP